ncbi:hypothetical protein GW793_00890 [bacterium]|uniref:Uncharacterized protein n=2 Tax=Katanobacteria TaxID=422282 RepID=A0A2M7X4L0_UNCKA|nr:hypothetical protein [bacterium]PIP56840.1 MAG: hypothetical protein COX05_00895 [candidate division WWE3 bacterium CG22_combo_CG10-13_8_21_14_all_39_12]PJA41088.1 MAG: hypothetical protein CO179_00660 [candidate division WWE3 bacterium CG_4_9_14_3_um_filter_39_7]
MPTEKKATPNRNLYILTALLAILIISTSWFLWSSSNELFSDPFKTFANPNTLFRYGIPLLISYIVVLSLIVVVSLIMNPWWVRTILYSSIVIPLIATKTPIPLIIIATLLIAIILIFFDVIIHRDIKIHITQPLVHIFGRHIALLSTLLSILFSGYIFVSTTATINETNLTIPQSLMTQAFTLSSPIIQSQIEGFVDTFQRQTISDLESQIPTLTTVPYEDKVLLTQGVVSPLVHEAMKKFGLSDDQIKNITNQISQSINDTTSKNQSSQQTIQEIKNDLENKLLDSVSEQVNVLLNDYKDLAPYVVALSSFSVLTALGYLINMLAIGFAWIIISILQKGNLIEIHTFNVEAKRYVIKKYSL